MCRTKYGNLYLSLFVWALTEEEGALLELELAQLRDRKVLRYRPVNLHLKGQCHQG